MTRLTIEWERLTDDEFESLCCDVLDREGYKNLKWTGGTGDRGRDIQATKPMKMTETQERMYDVIAECKKYLARPPAISDLQSTLGWADAHKPDLLMIMIANTPTSDTRDWLDMTAQDKLYDILVFDDKQFELFFDRHPDLYAKHFGGRRVPRDRVVRSLLDGKRKNLKSLSNETELLEEPLGAILGKLVGENLISREEGEEKDICYSLKTNVATFVEIARPFLDDEGKFEFLVSKYSESVIGSDLIDYIESRYHIKLSRDQKPALVKLFGLSPSALYAALFSATDMYDTGYAQIREHGLSPEQQDAWNQSLLAAFMSILLEKAVHDLRNLKGEFLSTRGIEGYHVAISIKTANSNTKVLDLEAQMAVVVGKAKGPVQAGQLLGASAPETHLRNGNVLLHLDLFERAITDYDVAISELGDKKKLAQAWNNKGVCLMSLGRKDEACTCFEKALENDSELKQASENRRLCK